MMRPDKAEKSWMENLRRWVEAFLISLCVIWLTSPHWAQHGHRALLSILHALP